MERGEAMTQPHGTAGARSGNRGAAVARTVATLAVVVALALWFAAESAYPAGAWMEQQDGGSLAMALAAAILIAACVSIPAALLLPVLVGALAAIPIGLWLSIRVGASVYAASLGALLTALVLYAFMRRAPSERDNADAGGFAGVPVTELAAAVKSVLLAVAGVGLLARVL